MLGFDDEMSRDHDWCPRVLLFLSEDNDARYADALRAGLPKHFRDRPADCSIVTLRSYFRRQLAVDIDVDTTPRDWLAMSEQQLMMITAGAVYHDDVGIQSIRDRFAYYPRDVWLYLLVAGWWRIHPELNLVGRTGFVGDELGSTLIASRLVNDLMHLCFLMERTYAPYSKWFATAFSRLTCADDMSPILWRILRAEAWPERENALVDAYQKVAAMHDALHITEPVPTKLEQMWDRPFKVFWGDFPGMISARIDDPVMKRIAERWPTGGIDQLRDILVGPRSHDLLLRVTE